MLPTESCGLEKSELKLPNARVSAVTEQAALAHFGKAQSTIPVIVNSLMAWSPFHACACKRSKSWQ
jgi:hypothetical protein